MMSVRQTAEFAQWMSALRDRKAQVFISKRIVRLQSGLSGDVKSVGDGVMGARIHFGPGYRLYYIQRGEDLIVLLCGGDKSSQDRDIARARRLSAALDEGNET